MSSGNPKNWRYTWEAQSHSPNLKLFLFDSRTKPSLHCHTLRVHFDPSRSHLLVSWTEESAGEVSLKVSVPKVLIDPEAAVNSRALDDHIEVKLVLLLPVDHPLVSTFDSVLSLNGDGNGDGMDGLRPKNADSDLKSLLSLKGGVNFYCRSCSSILTSNPIRHFVEMPSVNWQELADNWFGGCCCSFGGASEKLVNRYAHAYTCAKGVCYLSTAAVTFCKYDLLESKFAGHNGNQEDVAEQEFAGNEGLVEENGLYLGNFAKRSTRCDSKSQRMHETNEEMKLPLCVKNLKCEGNEEEWQTTRIADSQTTSHLSESMDLRTGCDSYTCHNRDDFAEVCVSDCQSTKARKLKPNQRSFLNGFLGDGFMARSQNLSMDIDWKQFTCPQCSSLLGSYPCGADDVPIDNGVRLFKCYIATSLSVGGSGDLFRKYTLGRMFTDQLVESAKDELSFRTLVRDLETKSPSLRVVLVNSSSWSCSGFCWDRQSTSEPLSKSNLQPVVKVLFSDCSGNGECQMRALEDWERKHLPDEVFMLRHLIEELIETLASAKDLLPRSCTSVQDFTLTSIQR